MIDDKTLEKWKAESNGKESSSCSTVGDWADRILQLIEALQFERGESQQAHAMVEDLLAQLDKKPVEIRHLNRQIEAKTKMLNKICDDKKVLMEALEFYVPDKLNYVSAARGQKGDPDGIVIIDNGQKARAALEKVK